MLFSLLYECFALILFFIYLPKMLYQMLLHKKYRSNFLKRFGFFLPKIPFDKEVIWIHAVSVGETLGIKPFVTMLKKEKPDAVIVISSVTETGHKEAKEALSAADYHLYMPFDLYLPITYLFSRIKPSLVLLAEGDLWWRFLHIAKKKDARVMIINGKISLTSTKRMRTFSFFSKRLLSLIDHFFLQTALYKDRIMNIGVPEEKITVTGNLKGDMEFETFESDELEKLKEKLAIKEGDRVIVIGSTHDPEEALLLDQLKPLFKKYASLKIIIAPRHPERFSKVFSLIDSYNVSSSRYSDEVKPDTVQVLLLDAMGVLRKAYALADIAIVGGSFISRVGGHNILEPQSFQKPVIVGPYMQTQGSLMEAARSYDAIIQLTLPNLCEKVDELLSSKEICDRYGANANKMLQSMKGSTKKTVEGILCQL